MRPYRRILVFVGLALAIAVLILSGLIRPLGDLGRRMTTPILERLASFPRWLAGVSEHLGSQANDPDQQIQDLRRQLAEQVIDRAHLEALEEENTLLRAQARFLSTSGFQNVGAHVMSRQIYSDRALLLIDRGRADGLEIGLPVVVGDGIFVGKVSELQEHVSTVELVTDAESRVAVSLLDQRHLIGVLEGRGNGAAVLTYIPSTEKLGRDQILVTAGTEEKVPPNLPVGIINTVDGKPTDPFLNASVDPLLSLDRILLVSVLLPR